MSANETFLRTLLFVARNISFQNGVPSASLPEMLTSRCSIKFSPKDGWRREGRTDRKISDFVKP